MPEQDNKRFSLSGFVATGKDLVAMLRDTVLLLLAILLIGWPQAINNILVDAGFEEGSFAGLKWKANLSRTDNTLVKAQAIIADLKDQNNKLNQALSEVKSKIDNPEVKTKITELEQLNAQLVASAARVQDSAESNISANASLVQKIQASTGQIVTWGIVYGGDQNLDAAMYEVHTIAPKFGLTNVAIYYRQGSYRSVATTTDRLQADQILNKAKERRKDSYIVNMSTWCPNTANKDSYFECLNH